MNNKLKLRKSGVLLRLQVNITDPSPNEYLNSYPFRGTLITSNNDLYFPKGELIDGQYIIVQQKDNANIFGYVRYDKLVPIMTGGKKHKIYRYKFDKYN